MAIDELLELTRVEFPQPLKPKEVEELFSYLKRNLQCEVQYHVGKNKQIGNKFEDVSSDRPKTQGVKLSGSITRRNVFATASFRCEHGPRHYIKFDGLNFETTPDYELHELPVAEVQLIRDVKKEIARYFAQKK